MTSDSSETDGSKPDLEQLVREEIADEPDATIVKVGEPDNDDMSVVVERRDSENQTRQILYHVALEPTPDNGYQVDWKWIGPYNEQ